MNKKYKTTEEKYTILQDGISNKFLEYYNTNSLCVDTIRNNLWNSFLVNLEREVNGRELFGEDACQVIDKFLNSQFMSREKEILSKKNIYYIMALSKRMNCAHVLKYFNSSYSAGLSKIFQNYYLIKFSNIDWITQFDFAQDYDYLNEDYLLIYRLELMGVFIQKLLVLKRKSAKGGGFKVIDGKIIDLTSDSINSALMEYDKLVLESKPSSLARWMGVLQPIKNENDKSINLFRKNFLINIIPNYDDQSFHFLKNKIVSSNHLPQFLKAEVAAYVFDGMDEVFKNKFGIDFHTWLKCLSEISSFFIKGDEIATVNSMSRAGYCVIKKEDYYSILDSNPEILKKDLEVFLKIASLTSKKQANIVLGSSLCDFCIIEIDEENLLLDGYLIINYYTWAMTNAFAQLSYLNLSQKITRGLVFENQVYEYVKKLNKKLKNDLLKPGFKIKNTHGDVIVEIDIPIIKDQLLIMLDCKSLIFDHHVEEGNYQATLKRKNKLLSLIVERDNQAKRLANESSQITNFENLPTFMLSHIISPVHEYLDPNEPAFWWQPGIPRVSTIEVFFDVVYVKFIQNLNNDNPFIYKK